MLSQFMVIRLPALSRILLTYISLADVLVPQLFRIIRASHIPTALRTSALSLLAQCASTNALALFPYANDLLSAMVDLLQVESATKPPKDRGSGDADKQQDPVTMDSKPTVSNSKLPPLRRAALYFLSLLFKSYGEQTFENGLHTSYMLSLALLDRTKHTVAYLAIADEDSVVRVMAKELVDTIEELYQIMLST